MPRRKSDVYLLITALGMLAALALSVHAHLAVEASGPALAGGKALVERMGLSDLCLFTDARYTRNPALADRNSAFQDSPLAMEHFPSGSLILPPDHLRRHGMD
ncbi:MAG: hypothetical protein ACM32K_08545 [Syntrophaceae bacterium]